ncbi:nitrile hydratase accessory protein [Nonomuraea sp. NPDC059194]|uniref:nitrile hydratase accessory protein n=1 Tax=Nonomuraea sp. NPDC059194 TaxID=3346764 RepID=UPI0036B5BFBA
MTLPFRLDVGSPAAPPRSNGELVFAEPWEGRAFGLAMAASQAGAFDWEDFRQVLIARIAAEPEAGYYVCWFEALEQVLLVKGEVTEGEVGERAARLAARPAGHDHMTATGIPGRDQVIDR